MLWIPGGVVGQLADIFLLGHWDILSRFVDYWVIIDAGVCVLAKMFRLAFALFLCC